MALHDGCSWRGSFAPRVSVFSEFVDVAVLRPQALYLKRKLYNAPVESGNVNCKV